MRRKQYQAQSLEGFSGAGSPTDRPADRLPQNQVRDASNADKEEQPATVASIISHQILISIPSPMMPVSFLFHDINKINV
jgi:hypothetical protein